MFERLQPSARKVLERAHTEAHRTNRSEVRAEHLLLALASMETGIACRVLAANGLTPSRIEAAMEATIALELDRGPLTQADAEALTTIGINLDQIRPSLERSREPRRVPPARPQRRRNGRLPFSSEVKRALAAAVAQAQQNGQGYIGTEHVLLGILACDRSLAVELLLTLTDPESLKTEVLDQLKRAS